MTTFKPANINAWYKYYDDGGAYFQDSSRYFHQPSSHHNNKNPSNIPLTRVRSTTYLSPKASTMRFITALVLTFATAAVTAAPQAAGAGTLASRQQCTVDCACLNEVKNRDWAATQRCCESDGGSPEEPYCRRIPVDTAEAGFGGCCGGSGWFECRTVICPE
ncbi:hypothetical protein MFIFM68171_01710 [Madurella fahalii]|uniref:Uncharacterized protein n=1 Tax=Madurella fahalii TaxID=1157608 RepID=A0ABQ0G164_9PEZI